MQRVTYNELMAMLMGMNGVSFATFQAITEPALLAGCPWKGDLLKVATVNGAINFNYGNSVNNQRAREDMPTDFVPMPRRWGQRLAGTPLVEHNGTYYIEVKVQRSLGYEYRLRSTGEVVPTELVTPWLRPPGRSRQGVQREVILRDYTLTNIQSIRMMRENYDLTDNLAA